MPYTLIICLIYALLWPIIIALGDVFDINLEPIRIIAFVFIPIIILGIMWPIEKKLKKNYIKKILKKYEILNKQEKENKNYNLKRNNNGEIYCGLYDDDESKIFLTNEYLICSHKTYTKKVEKVKYRYKISGEKIFIKTDDGKNRLDIMSEYNYNYANREYDCILKLPIGFRAYIKICILKQYLSQDDFKEYVTKKYIKIKEFLKEYSKVHKKYDSIKRDYEWHNETYEKCLNEFSKYYGIKNDIDGNCILNRLELFLQNEKNYSHQKSAITKIITWSILTALGMVGYCLYEGNYIYTKNQQPNNNTVSEYDKPAQYITVKYRDTQVDISNFDYLNTSNSSLVKGAWYDPDNEYMIINLDGINYHYCGFTNKAWSKFKNADSFGTYYKSHIKGKYDCRNGYVPSYGI